MKKWYQDSTVVTHIVDSHVMFKVVSIPNAPEPPYVLTFELNRELDDQLTHLIAALEAALLELTDVS